MTDRLSAVLLITRGVFIELKRRKDFYVLAILMALFVLSVIVINIVGVESVSTLTFLLNLGLTMAYYLAHILTLILMARQIPDEIDNRTLYPMLARPIDRMTYLFGKWFACYLCGFGVLMLLGAMARVAIPRAEYYSLGLGLQGIALLSLSIAMIAAMALFFSLVAPRGIGIVLIGIIAGLGHHIISFIQVRGNAFVDWLIAYVPNFRKLNLITRYTDGIEPLTIPEFGGLIIYGTMVTVAFLAMSAYLFQRRPV